MAMRLEKLIAASAESWLRMREEVELWRVRQLLKQPPADDFQTIDAGSTLD